MANVREAHREWIIEYNKRIRLIINKYCNFKYVFIFYINRKEGRTMTKVEIKKEMKIEGEIKDLSKSLDNYIERFNSGKVSNKVGWIEPTYIVKNFGKSTYDGTFEIKSVYKENDKYYFETDSEEVKNLVENEFFEAGKRVQYDNETEDLVVESIDLVGTEESYRYNKYKRMYSLSMNWFSDKVVLDVFELYNNFHIDPYRYYEIKFGNRLIYRGHKLETLLNRLNRDVLNFLYVPVRILKYKMEDDSESYRVEDSNIYKFPTVMFTDYIKDKSLKNNIIFDSKVKYNIKNNKGEDIGILVYDEFGTNDRYFVKYRASDNKILEIDVNTYTIFYHSNIILSIKEYFEMLSELEMLENEKSVDAFPLYYLDKVSSLQIKSGNKIHDILSSKISPWHAYLISDTFKNIDTKYTFLGIYSKYTTFTEISNGKEHSGAILADVYKPDALVEIDLEETDTKYNGKEFIRLFITIEGKVYYKVDNYNKLGINAVKVKEDESTKVYVTDKNGVDISQHFMIAKSSYKDDIVLFVDLSDDVNDYYIMSGIFDKLTKHQKFINEALDDFNKFKYEYETRLALLEMSEDELIEYFGLDDMTAEEFRKVCSYISKINFY